MMCEASVSFPQQLRHGKISHDGLVFTHTHPVSPSPCNLPMGGGSRGAGVKAIWYFFLNILIRMDVKGFSEIVRLRGG